MSKQALKLAEIFQNGMTLQRGKAIRVWGQSENAQNLTVFLGKENIFQGQIPEGAFEITLPPLEPAEDVNLRFETEDGGCITLAGVDIGEVWIAGGQSNMEFPLICDREGEETIAQANDEHFRYYEVGKYAFEGEEAEGLKDGSRWNNWRKFVPAECTHFSSTATFFAKSLRKQLGIPVAIVGCCWGGTMASSWLDDKLIREDPELRVYTDEYDRGIAAMNMDEYYASNYAKRKMMGSPEAVLGNEMMMKTEATEPCSEEMLKMVAQMLGTLQIGPHDENCPGALYQTMVRKIAGFTARGVIWYQGESDEHHAPLYSRLFTKVIDCWRAAWLDELPFLFVQLAPWQEWMAQNGKNYPVLREQQQYVEDHVTGTYMASIMDAGSQYDIHPKLKRPVGTRLALLALQEIYHQKQAYSHAPRVADIQRSGKEITVTFRFAEGGLKSEGNPAALFSVKQNGAEKALTGVVENSQVALSCETLEAGEAEISFAYRPFLVMNLFNQENLPARPMAPCRI